MQEEKVSRRIELDIFRAFLIILVVLGHSGWKYSKYIYWFHMPLFFFLSGLLWRNKDVNFLEFFKSLCKKYLPMHICAFFIQSIIMGSISLKDFVKFIYGGKIVLGVYWFIPVLIISECCFFLIENKCNSIKKRMVIYITLYSIAILESIFFIPKNIQRYHVI